MLIFFPFKFRRPKKKKKKSSFSSTSLQTATPASLASLTSVPSLAARAVSSPPPRNLPPIKTRGTVVAPVIFPKTAWISLPSPRSSSSQMVVAAIPGWPRAERRASLALAQ